MMTVCRKCRAWYNDEHKLTICPHPRLDDHDWRSKVANHATRQAARERQRVLRIMAVVLVVLLIGSIVAVIGFTAFSRMRDAAEDRIYNQP